MVALAARKDKKFFETIFFFTLSLCSMSSSQNMPNTVQMSGKGGKGKHLGKKMLPRRFQKNAKDPLLGATKPAIRRICRRGGVKRINGLIYEETRGLVKSWMENVLRDALTYCEHARRKTVTATDIVFAMKRQGQHLYGFGP